jgi:predicted nucleic acid-binding Zn ribbon protein
VAGVSDDPEESTGPDTPDVPDAPDTPRTPARSGVDVAREALAAARAEARRRGSAPRGKTRRAGGTGRRAGAGPDDRDPQPLGAAIERLLAERGWETPVAIGGVTGRWDEIVGAEIAGHCRPEGYDDGVLVVVADSSAWATQVRLLAPTLVRRLNEDLGDGTVRRVDVRGPASPSWKRGRLSVRGRGPRDTYG